MSSLDNTAVLIWKRRVKIDVRRRLKLYTCDGRVITSINQIVGYLISNDPAYIPRGNDARNLIRSSNVMKSLKRMKVG